MEPQVTPPGDIPLFEGLGVEWNDIVSGFPEDKRAELAPKLRDRISAYEPLKQWEDLHKSGVTPDQAGTALQLFSVIENNPKEVYDTLAKYLNITPAQAQEVVEEIQEGDSTDPRIQAMQQQIETMSQILIGQRQMSVKQQQEAEAETALQKEIETVQNKYQGTDLPEKQLMMRMLHLDMTADQAAQDYLKEVDAIRSRRPAPFVLGSGGNIPSRGIDPVKLDSKERKNLVAQMLDHANAEARK